MMNKILKKIITFVTLAVLLFTSVFGAESYSVSRVEAAGKKTIRLEPDINMQLFMLCSVCKNGRYIYMAGDLADYILKYDTKTGESVKLSLGKNKSLPYIMTKGDYIYFKEISNFGKKNYKCYLSRMKTDGTGKKRLVAMNGSFSIKGKKIYYSNKNKSYSMNLNGSGKKSAKFYIDFENRNRVSKYAKVSLDKKSFTVKNLKTNKSKKYKFGSKVINVRAYIVEDCVLYNLSYKGGKNEFYVMHYDGKNKHRIDEFCR